MKLSIATTGLFLCVCLSASREIHISDGAELEYHFCQNLMSNTKLVLQGCSNCSYQLQSGSFCIVSNVRNITVIGSQHQVEINCISKNIGFGFISSHELKIQNIAIVTCGSAFYNSVSPWPSHTPFAINNYSAAVLLFKDCTSVAVDNVSITHYYGYGILMLRVLGNVQLHNLVIQLSTADNTVHDIGSGLLVYHYDNSTDIASNIEQYYNDNISNVTISKSSNYISGIECLSEYFSSRLHKQLQLVAAGGLSLIHTQTQYYVNATITNSHFTFNYGTIAGGILILYNGFSTITIDASTIANNSLLNFSASCEGGDNIAIYTNSYGNCTTSIPSKFSLQHSIVAHNKHNRYLGQIHSSVFLFTAYKTMHYIFTFHNNMVSITGACMYAVSPILSMDKVQITLNDILAHDNRQRHGQPTAGIFTFVRINKVEVSGSAPQTTLFSNNRGSVIEAYSSNIHLRGHVTFLSNTAFKGAALKLMDSSKTLL